MSAFPRRLLSAAEPGRDPGDHPRPAGSASAGAERKGEAEQIVRRPPASGEPASGDIGYVLDALRLGLDQELQISQRLRDRARQIFVLAIAFFTIVQTVAFGAFAQGAITHHRAALTTVLALGIVAIMFLAATAYFVARADAPSQAGNLPLGALTELVNNAYNRDPDVPGEVGEIYLGIIEDRRVKNGERLQAVRAAQLWGLCSVGVTTVELVVALALRIP